MICDTDRGQSEGVVAMRKQGGKSKPPIQRTVILTLGDVGAAVAQRLRDILGEWRTPPVVTVAQLDPDSQSHEPSELSTAIGTALRDVSRLSHRTTVDGLGYSAGRLEELVIWVVGASTASLTGAARLAKERSSAMLGVDPLVLGLVLGAAVDSLEDPEHASQTHPTQLIKVKSDETASCPDSEPSARDTSESSMLGSSSTAEVSCDAAEVEDEAQGLDIADTSPDMMVASESADQNDRPGVPPSLELPVGFSEMLSGPCYVATPVNEAGLVLDGASALYEHAARFIALHVCTPLRDAPAWVEQSRGWDNGLGCVSVGLAWVAWPGGVAQRRAARRVGGELMPLLIGPPDICSDVDGLLREAKLMIPDLVPRLTPRGASELVHSATDETLEPTLAAAFKSPEDPEHPVIEFLEGRVAEWEEGLSACAEAWETLLQTSIKTVTAEVRSWVGDALDRDGFASARRVTDGLERRFSEHATGAEQRYLELEGDHAQMESQATDVLSKLTSVLEKMPQRRLRDLLVLMRRPSHWVQLWLRWRRVKRLCTQYLLLRGAVLETQVAVEQMQRACGLFWAAGSELVSISKELDRLEAKLEDLLAPKGEAPEWPEMPLLMGEDPGRLLDGLMEEYLPALQSLRANFLADLGPLSAMWTGKAPSQSTVDEWLMRVTSRLADVPTWDVIRFRYRDADELRAWLHEMSAHAAPLRRWDLTAVFEYERAEVGTVTALLSPPSEGPREDDSPGWRSLPLARIDGLAVVTMRWGVPISEGQTQALTGSPADDQWCTAIDCQKEVSR